ncbi:MAG: carboxypeptidase regulatory-like domain-containing protein [Elusimicrobia bacterium]|nr:carboxypeptidase regulatory-like domain-containing protein [Elusimicrobiota bacterium]
MRLALIAAIVALGRSPALAQQAKLTGHVNANPRVEASGSSGGAYAGRAASTAKLFDYKNLKNVVIYAEPVSSHEEGDSGGPTVTVRRGRYGATFEPNFAVVPANGRVTFNNASDERLILSAGGESVAPFTATLDKGQEQKFKLTTRGIYHVFCPACGGQRDEVKIYSAGPYFAVADEKGAYSISLPAGDYKITAWHERLPPQRKRVSLRADEKAQIDFTLSVFDLPEVK